MSIDYYPPLIGALSTDGEVTTDFVADFQQNFLLNGDFQVWQRGTTFAVPAVASTYTADRWAASRFSVAGMTISQGSPPPPGTGYSSYCHVSRNAGDASLASLYICQNLETVVSKNLAQKYVTLSYLARCGASFSAANAQLINFIQTGTGTDQNGFVSYTGSASKQQNQGINQFWTYYSFSSLLPATTTEVCVFIGYVPTGVAGAADYFDVTGIQLNIGTTVLPYQKQFQGIQLTQCQRYYQKSFPYATVPGTGATGTGASGYQATRAGVNNTIIAENFNTRMRAAPTITYFNPVTGTSNWRNTTLGADSGVASSFVASERSMLMQNPQVAGDAIGNTLLVHWTADAEL